jgi:hypothetical protein
MDGIERQREFEQIVRETEDIHKRAEFLKGIERIDQLFVAADRVGINRAAAWKIIEGEATNHKAGLLALIDRVRTRANSPSV